MGRCVASSRIRRSGTPGPCARVLTAALLIFGGLAGGCSYKRDESAVLLAERGRFGLARERVAASATDDPESRNFILDQMKLVAMGLAEGVPDIVEPTADRLYDRLRTQGLNDDNRFAQVMLTEGAVKIYKGDPFEQALAYYNIALLDGVKGDWGNMRAASQQSLFLLRDFSKSLQERGGAATSRADSSGGGGGSSRGAGSTPAEESSEQVALVRAAARAEQEGKSGDALGIDYTPIASDFEIGYILKAIAARQLGEREDMQEAVATLKQIAPRLNTVADLIATGSYNTVFVVDFGMAPEKYGTGPDNAIAARAAVTPSDDSALAITVSPGASSGGSPAPQASTWPVVTDVNRIATSTRWANLEDVRVAKSNIGSVLLAGGLITAVAADDDNHTQQMVGVILAGVGALMKATSSADTRHNELFPQRTYIALADLAPGFSRVELSVPGSTLVFPQLPVAQTGGTTLHYVRMPTRAEPWAIAEQLRYSNDVSGDPYVLGGGSADAMMVIPYILGGRDVRTPSLDVLRSCQNAGFLRGLSLDDLQQLYRDEGIEVAGTMSSIDATGLHVLDGGTWLYTPLPGSTGFKRLFYGEHEPYRPRSKRVKELHEQIADELGARRRVQEQAPSARVEGGGATWNEQGADRGVVSEVFHGSR